MALIYAIVRQRQGRSRDMNKWLWARIAFQGLTIGAVVVGSYAMGSTAQQIEAKKQSDEAFAVVERAGFEARLRAAEVAHAEESVGPPVQKQQPVGVGLVRSAVAASGPVSTEPAGVKLVRSAEPASGPAECEPAGVQVMHEGSGKKGWW